jgi:hypothetical protein
MAAPGITAAVVALSVLVSLDAAAQDWPTRAITIVNPVAAGGSNELVKAIILDRVAAALGVPIVMESRSGAGGTIGAAYVAKAAPDGYTLLIGGHQRDGDQPGGAQGPALRSAARFHPDRHADRDRGAPDRSQGAAGDECEGVRRARPLATGQAQLRVVWRAVRRTSSPSSCSIVSPGSTIVGIPYRGSAPLLLALRAGEVQSALEYPPTIMPYLSDGTFRVLGVAARSRSRLFPDMPTLIEQGYNVSTGGYIMLVAPAGLPPAIADRLNSEVNKVLAMPDVRQRYPRHRIRARGRHARRRDGLDRHRDESMAARAERHRLRAD